MAVDRFERDTSGRLSRVGSAFKAMGTLAAGALGLGATGLAGGMAIAVRSAAGFEQSLADVRAATGASAESMKLMRAEALKIGADTSKSASEAVAAMGELTKSGVSVEAAVGGVARTVVQMSEATGASVGDMATLMADSLNVFKLGAGESTNAANILAKAAGASSIDIKDMAQSLSAGGLVAAQAGLSINDFATAIGIMGNQGLKASDAGTSLKAMIAGLTPNSKDAAAAMQELGFSAFDAAGNFKSMPEIIANLEKSFGPLTEKQRATNAELIFGSDGVRALNALLSGGVGEWNKFTQAMADAPSIAEQSATKLNTLSGRIETLKGSLETMAINIGSKVIPVITDLVETANRRLPEVEQAFKNLLRDWGPEAKKAFDAVVEQVGRLQTKVQEVKDAVEPMAVGLFGWFMQEAQKFIVWFEQNWPNIQKAHENVSEAMRTTWRTLMGDMEGDSGKSANEIQNNLTSAVENVLEAFRSGLSLIIALGALDWKGAWEFAKEDVTALAHAYSDLERAAMALIERQAKALIDVLGGAISYVIGLWDRAIDGVRRFVDSLPSLVDAWRSLQNLSIPRWMEKILPGSDPPTVVGIKMTKKALADLAQAVASLGGPSGATAIEIMNAELIATRKHIAELRREMLGVDPKSDLAKVLKDDLREANVRAQELAASLRELRAVSTDIGSVGGFAQAQARAGQTAQFASVFGTGGAGLINALADARTDDSATAGAQASAALQSFISGLKTSGLDPGGELARLIIQSFTISLEDPSAIEGLMFYLRQVQERATEAGRFTGESLGRELGKALAASDLEQAVGSTGAKLIDELDNIWEEGKSVSAQAVAEMSAGILAEMRKLPPEVGGPLSADFRRALEAFAENPTQESLDEMRRLMAQSKGILAALPNNLKDLTPSVKAAIDALTAEFQAGVIGPEFYEAAVEAAIEQGKKAAAELKAMADQAKAEMEAAAAWFKANGYDKAFPGASMPSTTSGGGSSATGDHPWAPGYDFQGAVSPVGALYGGGMYVDPDAMRRSAIKPSDQEFIRAIRDRAAAFAAGLAVGANQFEDAVVEALLRAKSRGALPFGLEMK